MTGGGRSAVLSPNPYPSLPLLPNFLGTSSRQRAQLENSQNIIISRVPFSWKNSVSYLRSLRKDPHPPEISLLAVYLSVLRFSLSSFKQSHQGKVMVVSHQHFAISAFYYPVTDLRAFFHRHQLSAWYPARPWIQLLMWSRKGQQSRNSQL